MKEKLKTLFFSIAVSIALLAAMSLFTGCYRDEPAPPPPPPPPPPAPACATGWVNAGVFATSAACSNHCATRGHTLFTWNADGNRICCCI